MPKSIISICLKAKKEWDQQERSISELKRSIKITPTVRMDDKKLTEYLRAVIEDHEVVMALKKLGGEGIGLQVADTPCLPYHVEKNGDLHVNYANDTLITLDPLKRALGLSKK